MYIYIYISPRAESLANFLHANFLHRCPYILHANFLGRCPYPVGISPLELKS